MPEIEFNSQEVRLIDLASRGLFQTVNSQYIKSALTMAKIRPKVIDEAIKTAIISASQVSTEEAGRRWNIVVMLCGLKSKTHQPSQEVVDRALEQAAVAAAKTNNWKFFIALINLTDPACKPSLAAIDKTLVNAALTATKTNNWDFVIELLSLTTLRQPSQIAVDRAFELATVTALQTNNWKSIIALSSVAAPVLQPSKRAINASLELALLRMIRYERHGDINSSSKVCEAIKAIISLQPPANTPDKEFVDMAFNLLQRRIDKHFINSARYGEWEQVLNYFIQDQWGKPSQKAMNCVLTYALTATAGESAQVEVFKALCSFMQPDKRTAGNLLHITARTGHLDVVQLLCNLDEQNKPSLYFIKNALQIAQYAGNHKIASYLSYEVMHQHHLEHDPLALTKTILTDYCDHHATMSNLFNTQLKQVKTILAAVKRTDKETEEDVRNEAAMEAVNQLKAMREVNKELKVCIDYIEVHCRKKEDTPSIKAGI